VNTAAISVDEEALALRQFYFADDDNVIIRHFPEARASYLCWQVGVLEDHSFHLLVFASTKTELIALLDGHNGLPS
jgi:hypothetical protein